MRIKVFLVLIMAAMSLMTCTPGSQNPATNFQHKNIDLEINDSLVVDIYRIMITSKHGKSEYYQKASDNLISVSIPTEIICTVTVDLYSNNIKTFTGAIEIDPDVSGLVKLIVLPVQKSTNILPGMVTSLSGSVISGHIQLQWNIVSAADGYIVYRTTDTLKPPIEICATNNTSMPDSQLTAGFTYYYCISAYNAVGVSDKSYFIPITVPESVNIPSPQNVNAKVLNLTTIQIKWDSVPQATSYQVYRTDYETQKSEILIKTDLTECIDDNLISKSIWGYSISTLNQYGESKPTAIFWVNINKNIPTIPEGLNATSLSENSLHIKWDPVDCATSYIIQYSTSQYGLYSSIEVVTTESVLTNLVPSTQYYLKVIARNNISESQTSELVSVKTLEPAIQQPSIPVLEAIAVSDKEIEITWQQVQNASFYIIEQSLNNTGPFTAVCTTSTFNYMDSGLTPATIYYFRGKAINSAGESEFSKVISVATSNALQPPSNVNAASSGTSSIHIFWNLVTGASGYILYWGTSSSSMSVLDTITDSSFIQTNLSSSSTYYYKVSTIVNGCESEKSELVSATTDQLQPPATPTGLTAAAASSTSILINFNPVSGAESYNLYWSTSNTNFTLLAKITSTSYTHSDLVANTEYHYKVTSVNKDLESVQSSTASATTQSQIKVYIITSSRCTGCGNCVSACSERAISRSGRIYVIDPSKCKGCGDCVSRCRQGAISLQQ